LPISIALALAGQGRAIQAVEDNHVGGPGSKLARAVAAIDEGPKNHSLAVCNMPESGSMPDAVLA